MVSGKFVLRLDPEIHSALKKEALAKGESLNSLCLQKLKGCLTNPWQGVIERVVQHFNPLGIVLFGSKARGDDTSESDIDLLIVLQKKISINRSLYRQWDSEFKAVEKFSPQFVHFPNEDEIGGIWLEAAIDGEILYDSEAEVKRTLRSIRALIANGVYQRKMSYGHPYWKRRDSDAK
jgi:predicted nucleotidyltransferase